MLNKFNVYILEVFVGIWNKGFVKGLFKEVGWGVEFGFFGLMLGLDGLIVDGYIFSLE